MFHSDPPKALINYADAIEEDGYLDEVGQLAWRDAGRAWVEYGDRPILSSYGIRIRLNDRDRNVEEAAQAEARLAEIAVDLEGIRDQLVAGREAALTEEQRAAMAVDPAERTDKQSQLAYEAQSSLAITLLDIANETPEEVRNEARRLARQAAMANEQVRIIDRYREIVNFVYWKRRCEVEQLDETVAARKLVLEADEAFADARFEEARDKYEQAWDKWANILDEYDILVDDVEGEILYEAVERYRKVLGQLDETFPPPGFKLMRLVREYDPESAASESPVTIEAPAAED